MAKPAYSVTAEDFLHAAFYLGAQLRNYGIEFDSMAATEKAKAEFQAIAARPASSAAAKRLQHWCDQYLTQADWERLKSSVRKRRQRQVQATPLKTVVLSQKAHRLLSKLSKRDSVTLSEALERYLPGVLNKQPLKTKQRREKS